MAGPLGTMYIAGSGLRAMQNSVNAAANNIANAQTEGYSRRRVNLVTNTPQYLQGIGEVNTGVRIDSVIRVRDGFLDKQVRAERATFGLFEARGEALDQLEMIFREPSTTGLNTVMNEMWDSWQELSKAPESSTSRTVVVQQAITMTDMFNHMGNQIDDVRGNLQAGINQTAFDANTLIQQIRDVDNQIINVKIKEIIPNDLLDQRDLLLDKLSDLVDIRTQDQADGGISLRVSGREVMGKTNEDLVMSTIQSVTNDGGGQFTLTILEEGAAGKTPKTVVLENVNPEKGALLKQGGTFFHDRIEGNERTIDLSAETEVALAVPKSGRITGQQEMLAEMDVYENELNTLARGIGEIINLVHRAGNDTVDTDAGWINFFTAGDGDPDADNPMTAKNIRVNQEIQHDVFKINGGEGDLTNEGPAGDGTRALAIAQLRNFRFDVNNPVIGNEGDQNAIVYQDGSMGLKYTGVGGDSTDNFYRNSIGRLGISAQQADRMVQNQESLLNQLNQRKEAVSGVSIDEEIADLIKFQNGYQANARVMTTLTLMLDTLINLGR